MRTKASTGKIRQTYEFIKANRNRFDVRTMRRVLEVAPSGYYAWLQEPVCQRALERGSDADESPPRIDILSAWGQRSCNTSCLNMVTGHGSCERRLRTA
jgi:hypothetical protein